MGELAEAINPGEAGGCFGIVKCVVQPGDGSSRVGERRVGGDVWHLLAVVPNLAAILKAGQIALAGEHVVREGQNTLPVPSRSQPRGSGSTRSA